MKKVTKLDKIKRNCIQTRDKKDWQTYSRQISNQEIVKKTFLQNLTALCLKLIFIVFPWNWEEGWKTKTRTGGKKQ